MQMDSDANRRALRNAPSRGRLAEGGPLLVLEGALFPPGAGVVACGELLAVETLPQRRGAGGDLFDAARRVLRQAGIAVAELGGVVVGTGPGSFTGLRVALGAAQGLRFAFGETALPLVGVDSPAVLAAAAAQDLPVRVAVPWGRLRILVARATAAGPLAQPADLFPLTQLGDRLDLQGERVVIPPEARDLPWPGGVQLIETRMSPVAGLARVAAEIQAGQRAGSAADPVYLVAPDAILPQRAASAPAGRRIEELGAADLEQILVVEKASFDSPWSRSTIEGELTPGPRKSALGIRAAGKRALDACALARWDDEVLEIISVAVIPPCRGGGLARALVREMVARARGEQLVRVDLEVSTINPAAIGLYASEGFVPVGRRRNYYPDGSDAILMSLMLRRS